MFRPGPCLQFGPMPGQSSTHRSSLVLALNAEAGAVPEWIELIPAGAVIKGRDGRSWTNPDPQAVIDASNVADLPLPVDWEHATQLKGPEGEQAPAAAWIEELQLRDAAIWGRAVWTPPGQEQVANRQYRFVSPVFRADKKTGRIVQLVSVGLTNAPNLLLTAQNREEPNREQTETPLTLATRLREALGLAADATEDAIVTAATTSVAANRSGVVDLTKFAPRSDLETALNRATTAETELKARTERDHDAAIETALNSAQAEGKITPASRASYLAMCKAEGGLPRFVELVKTLPPLTGAAATIAANRADPKQTGDHGLTETELAVCRQLGQDPVEFAKSKKED